MYKTYVFDCIRGIFLRIPLRTGLLSSCQEKEIHLQSQKHSLQVLAVYIHQYRGAEHHLHAQDNRVIVAERRTVGTAIITAIRFILMIQEPQQTKNRLKLFLVEMRAQKLVMVSIFLHCNTY